MIDHPSDPPPTAALPPAQSEPVPVVRAGARMVVDIDDEGEG